MLEPVARHLVPLVRHASDEARMTLGNPAEREEGRLRSGFGEEIEEPVGVALDPARQVVPRIARDHVGEGLDLEIILDIDRERIEDAWIRGGGSVRAGRCPHPFLGGFLRAAHCGGAPRT